MPFSQSAITSVSIARDGPDLIVSWASSSPANTYAQVYLDGKLAGSTQRRYMHLPYPNGIVHIEIGEVAGLSERLTNFSSSLPASPLMRATISWLGGTYLDSSGNDDVSGFRIYGSSVAGGSVDYTKVLATVPLYVGGIILDGFGLGGFGLGGFGRAASSYSWTSNRLGAGTWRFGIVPFDRSGNATGSPSEIPVTIVGPPRPVGASPDGTRLSVSYNPSSHVATLNWNQSPL